MGNKFHTFAIQAPLQLITVNHPESIYMRDRYRVLSTHWQTKNSVTNGWLKDHKRNSTVRLRTVEKLGISYNFFAITVSKEPVSTSRFFSILFVDSVYKCFVMKTAPISKAA